jgi:hypothetical protein
MSAKTCLWCGMPVRPLYRTADTPAQRTRRLTNHLRRQRLCRDCSPRWDIGQCPDGHDHEWVPVGSCFMDGPFPPYPVEECNRCGVVAICDPGKSA